MKRTGNEFLPLTVEQVLSPGFIAMWESFNQGIMIINKENICLYINSLQKQYDKLRSADLVGKDYTEFYKFTHEESLTRQCLQTQQPILNKLRVYKTIDGTVHQAITNVFPLFSEETHEIEAAVNFAIEMDIGRELFTLFSDKNKKKKQPRYSTRVLKKFTDIIGKEAQFCDTIKYARKIAKTNSSVMITGETGTGKELFAQSIHNASPRAKSPFTPINCAAIPKHLLESILFGTTKGSYTNAIDKVGLLELADQGSIFLDEINSMNLELQAKILRVIQEKRIRRIGASREIKINVRIISSINIDPGVAIEKKILREDLFYRLAVIVISIPPLCRRKPDIPILAEFFIKKISAEQKKSRIIISDEVNTLFFNYNWPGNIRELEHTIEAAASALKDGETVITKSHLSSYFIKKYNGFRNQDNDTKKEETLDIAMILKDLLIQRKKKEERKKDLSHKEMILNYIIAREKEKQKNISLPEFIEGFETTYITHVLKLTGGNVTKAAQRLGISGQSLHYKLKKLKIDRQKSYNSESISLLPI